jgi:hypothetical protein
MQASGGRTGKRRWRVCCAATFLFLHEAAVAWAMLRSAGTLFYLENEHVLSHVWAWNYALGGIRLMVGDDDLSSTTELLGSILLRLEAPVNRDRSRWRERVFLSLADFLSPAIGSLHLFYILRA